MGVFRRGPARRGLLALQQFVDPRAELILEADDEQAAEDGQGGGGPPVEPAALRAELDAALGRSPLDIEEIRAILARARDAGLDWRSLFDEAGRAAIAERPYLAPSLPPVSRVAPAESADAPDPGDDRDPADR